MSDTWDVLDYDASRAALRRLVLAVEEAGGIVPDEATPDVLALADEPATDDLLRAYLDACRAIGRAPMGVDAPSHGEDTSTAIRFYEAESADDPSLPERASCRGGSGPYLLPIEDETYGGVIAWANTPEQAERIVAALRGSQRRAAEWYEPADFPPGASA